MKEPKIRRMGDGPPENSILIIPSHTVSTPNDRRLRTPMWKRRPAAFAHRHGHSREPGVPQADLYLDVRKIREYVR